MILEDQRRFWQKGAIDLLALLVLTIITLAVPLTARLVKEKQEVRKEAAGNCKTCEVYVSQTCYRDIEYCATCYQTCYDTCYDTCRRCISRDENGACEDYENYDCNPHDCNPHNCNPYQCNCESQQEPYECGSCEPDPKCNTVSSDECNVPEDCQAEGRCNVSCSGSPRKCHWEACSVPVACGPGDCNTSSFNCEQDGGKCEGTKPNCSCNYPPAPTSTSTLNTIQTESAEPEPTATPTEVPVQGCTNPSGQTGDSYCRGSDLLTCVYRFGIYYWDGKTCPYGCANSACNTPVLTCDGKPNGTKECTADENSYNECNNGSW